MLYQDQFEVTDVGEKFDKVSRLHCRLTEETDDMDAKVVGDVTNTKLSTQRANGRKARRPTGDDPGTQRANGQKARRSAGRPGKAK